MCFPNYGLPDVTMLSIALDFRLTCTFVNWRPNCSRSPCRIALNRTMNNTTRWSLLRNEVQTTNVVLSDVWFLTIRFFFNADCKANRFRNFICQELLPERFLRTLMVTLKNWFVQCVTSKFLKLRFKTHGSIFANHTPILSMNLWMYTRQND